MFPNCYVNVVKEFHRVFLYPDELNYCRYGQFWFCPVSEQKNVCQYYHGVAKDVSCFSSSSSSSCQDQRHHSINTRKSIDLLMTTPPDAPSIIDSLLPNTLSPFFGPVNKYIHWRQKVYIYVYSCARVFSPPDWLPLQGSVVYYEVPKVAKLSVLKEEKLTSEKILRHYVHSSEFCWQVRIVSRWAIVIMLALVDNLPAPLEICYSVTPCKA